MSDLKERAIKYAEVKAKKALTSAIAQAYIDGYSTGWKERGEGTPINPDVHNVQFVDLGLKSKTLWSSDYLLDKDGKVLYLPYEKAQTYQIPTKEQWLELKESCNWSYKRENEKSICFKCIGPNGNFIYFRFTDHYEGDSLIQDLSHICNTISWFSHSDNEDNSYSLGDNGNGVILKYEQKNFLGFRYPVRLVKQ